MRAPRILAAAAFLAAAGLIVLVALPRDAAHSEAPPAAFTTDPAGRSVSVIPARGLFDDPATRGLCLVFDEGLSRPAYADSRAAGYPVAAGALVIRAGATATSFAVRLGRGEYRLCVPTPGLTPQAATRIELRWETGEPPVLGRVEALRAADGEPIPADLGVILQYRRDRWRDPRYELYRWSTLPQILILDTASYDVQDRFFKRLAFFVEKKGYAGTIPDYRSIADLHGFNAHDYRARDLASFYRTAAATGTTLLAEEIELRDILVAAGVLVKGETGYAEGVGGVLSISRGTATVAARGRLLAHESLHGVYFASERFRFGVEGVWSRLTDDLKEFFRLYFAWPDWGYDVSNPYLLVNEFMAYMLQYGEADALELLFESGSRWLIERYPARKSWVLGFRDGNKEGFLRAHRELERELWRELGAIGGGLVSLAESADPAPLSPR